MKKQRNSWLSAVKAAPRHNLKRPELVQALEGMKLYDVHMCSWVTPLQLHDTVRKRLSLRDKRFRTFVEVDNGVKVLFVVRTR